jgi:hypothetical protein
MVVSILDANGRKIDLMAFREAAERAVAPSFGPAPVNNFLHSLFSQIDVFLNDKLVSTSNNLYAYRAYLENLLNYGSDATDSQLSCALFYPDVAGKFDTNHLDNIAMDKRIVDAYTNSSFDMIGNLHSDVFHQNRYLLNNVDLKLRLMRSRTEFCLYTPSPAAAGYKIKIHQATLYVHKVKIAPSLILAHAQLLGKQTARYPFHRVEMKSFTIATGLSMINRDNLVLGQLPTHVIVGLVDSQAENGAYKSNPFNFKHFHLNYLSLQVGSESIPSVPLQPNFKSGLHIREYQSLLDSLGYWHLDKGISITRQTYPGGYTLYGFNLTPTQQQCNEAFNLLKQGNLQMNMKFAEATPNPVTVICYMIFENMMEVDKSRNVMFDFAM